MTVEFERGKVYVVDRGQAKLRAGQGLLAGLDVVIRHFVSAFGKKLENPSQTIGVFTVQYPEERLRLPEAYRNFPILLYDDESGQELCTSCFQCQRICPPQVIHMAQAKDPATGKAVPAITEFLIEYDACMSCGLCAEVCPFDAIKMDHEFELATDAKGGLTWGREQLNRPVSYYEQIAPTFWAEARDGAMKKLQGSVKRRSGLLGVAPQMVEQIKARLPHTESAAPAEAAAPALAAPATTDDKATRLAAIRARNAAKQADQGAKAAEAALVPESATPTVQPAPTPEIAALSDDTVADAPIAEVPTAPSVDEKTARLAAIRAKNAAKRAPEGGNGGET